MPELSGLDLQKRLAAERADLPIIFLTGLAGELGISEITVKVHRGNVMRKMAAASLPDLVNMSAKLGLRDTGA